MASIREVPAKTRRFERVGAHTHVKGLGLDKNMKAVDQNRGRSWKKAQTRKKIKQTLLHLL